MPITIKDILELDVFKSHSLLAGSSGLDNMVKTVGIIDHETEDMILGSYLKDEFVISTFFIIKNEPQKLYGYVDKLIQANVSGLAIKDIYFNDIPLDVVDLANQHSFPIFIFNEVYYESLITSIVNAIKDKECVEAISIKIDNILTGNLNRSAVERLAYQINRGFKQHHITVFCAAKDKTKVNGMWQYLQRFKPFAKYNAIIPYDNGYLIIYTFEQLCESDIETIILSRLNDIGITNGFYIGVSSLYNQLHQLYFSISESIYAYKHAKTSKKDLSFFTNIGTSKILVPVLDNIWVKKYLQEMINPILAYDKKNDSSLLVTAIKYIDNNGDIKATSKDLFQHSNTIRYRIEKIKKILSVNNNIQDFYEELSIVIKLYKLNNGSM